jgi:hypothetical protein
MRFMMICRTALLGRSFHFAANHTSTVNIHAPLSENVDAMMSIQYSSFPPCFQTTLVTGSNEASKPSVETAPVAQA